MPEGGIFRRKVVAEMNTHEGKPIKVYSRQRPLPQNPANFDVTRIIGNDYKSGGTFRAPLDRQLSF